MIQNRKICFKILTRNDVCLPLSGVFLFSLNIVCMDRRKAKDGSDFFTLLADLLSSTIVLRRAGNKHLTRYQKQNLTQISRIKCVISTATSVVR